MSKDWKYRSSLKILAAGAKEVKETMHQKWHNIQYPQIHTDIDSDQFTRQKLKCILILTMVCISIKITYPINIFKLLMQVCLISKYLHILQM